MCNQRQRGWQHSVVPRWRWVQSGRLRSSQYFAPSLFFCVSFSLSLSISTAFHSLSLSFMSEIIWDAKMHVLWRLSFWWQHTVQSRATKEYESNSMCSFIQHHNALSHSWSEGMANRFPPLKGHMVTHMILTSFSCYWQPRDLGTKSQGAWVEQALMWQWWQQMLEDLAKVTIQNEKLKTVPSQNVPRRLSYCLLYSAYAPVMVPALADSCFIGTKFEQTCWSWGNPG